MPSNGGLSGVCSRMSQDETDVLQQEACCEIPHKCKKKFVVVHILRGNLWYKCCEDQGAGKNKDMTCEPHYQMKPQDPERPGKAPGNLLGSGCGMFAPCFWGQYPPPTCIYPAGPGVPTCAYPGEANELYPASGANKYKYFVMCSPFDPCDLVALDASASQERAHVKLSNFL
eukprot:gnl/MRDRNA2_/MRDRNA2_28533_c0_seq1.p1 gnl/MRDRNA2_/MRDRNA2_28533_c0~~gnl/MRDRNA2_/MRDRNA2_28533_c0_seq1.p1  ORF type:complete len:172 (-),score=18.80 gnl/MRDRNA2_/MRDRNA2_28533_c0_seq1:11-526(-)